VILVGLEVLVIHQFHQLNALEKEVLILKDLVYVILDMEVIIVNFLESLIVQTMEILKMMVLVVAIQDGNQALMSVLLNYVAMDIEEQLTLLEHVNVIHLQLMEIL
jgi:hypothetical protein